MSERFAMIRQPEAEALKRLSSNAAKALMAMKFGRSDGEEIAFGVRDLAEWGLSSSTAARALDELKSANLIEIVSDSAFGVKKKRRTWRVVNVRQEQAEQSHRRETGTVHSATGGTIARKQSRQGDCDASLQSHGRDTPRTPSFPPVRREGKEGGQDVQAADAEREAAVTALKEQQARIGAAAKAVAMADMAFIRAAGGPKAADFLARKFDRGELTALQLRAKLADSEAGLLKEVEAGPMVFATASGSAR